MLCDSFRRLLDTRRFAVGATCCEQAHRKRSSEAALDKGARHLDCQSFNMFGLASAAATDRLAVASGTLAGRDAPRPYRLGRSNWVCGERRRGVQGLVGHQINLTITPTASAGRKAAG